MSPLASTGAPWPAVGAALYSGELSPYMTAPGPHWSPMIGLLLGAQSPRCAPWGRTHTVASALGPAPLSPLRLHFGLSSIAYLHALLSSRVIIVYQGWMLTL